MVFGHSPRSFIQTDIYQREIKLPYHNFDIDNIFQSILLYVNFIKTNL